MSVNRQKDGTWYFSIRIVDDFGNIKQVKKQSKNWKLKRDAIEAERQFLNSHTFEVDNITYNKLYSLFINYKSNKIKKRSILTYREVNERQIIPHFGDWQIKMITKESIRNWQQELLAKGYENSYIKTIQSNFKRVLNWGLNNDLIHKNPFTIEYIKRESVKREMNFFTLEEFNTFISVIQSKTDRLIFLILYWCGVRKGELQALTFNDIDLSNKTLSINKAYDSRNRIVTTPKNQTSYREIYIPNFLLNELIIYINESKHLAGFDSNQFLFGIDHPISSTTIERKKNNYCKVANVNQIRVHDFRHSHVSLMINNSVSDFDIAKRLGHSRDMVNNVYGHWFTESQKSLADKLNTLQNEYTK